ncbi:hypothetical protein F5888DRAFT_1644778 [Russula emetica]|nr:hypothetical protein F5888DRAFT_1644778 [Russula emetica]
MAIPTESFPAGSPNTRSRHARISFPPTDPPSDPDSFGDHSSIGLGPPPMMRRTSTGLEIGTSGEHRTEGRRRVKSAHVPSALSGRPQAQRHAQTVRRILTTSETTRPLKYERGRWNTANVESSSLDEVEPGVFSDEYDLYPKILEEVQRALKLKLRREARLAARANDSSVSTSPRSSPVRYSLPPLNPQASRIAKPSLESELDFSPSVGIDRLHPVPTSTDDGATLDWGGTFSEEDKSDRKWSLSLTKRKPKDRPFPTLSRDVLDRQEATFSEKISRIKSFAQPHTLKKAVITADQLRRRYTFLSNSLKTEPQAGNPILTVAKWNTGLDPLVQAVLEQAEPLTWLKHLRAKRPGRSPRFPWHVTALLFEERVRAQARLAAMAMETIPEDALSGLESSPFRRSLDDSRQNSLYSGFFNGSRSHGASPSSSRVYLRDLASRSDEASSSHHSASEDNGRADDFRKRGGKRRHFFMPPDQDLILPAESRSPETDKKEPQSSLQQLDTASPRPDRLLRGRLSLPSSPSHSWAEPEKEEYERRAELLENTIAQNQRNRYLLQRIAGGIKEYEAIQANLSKTLGLSYKPLPPELIDAFSHDPAVVTGATRQKRGWQAVEDITRQHSLRQRSTVREFLRQARDVEVAPPSSVLDSPLKSLQQSLDAWNSVGALFRRKYRRYTLQVKSEYNSAMSHTSSVYPELSEIIALEERYKDRYQQLWEFGMDALTILLDSVTPFWRNYGKVIGIDAQDFLIIPWYRNEFTGEPERYPIKALPRRSFRHWVALVLFFFTSLAVLILQARAANSFSSLYRFPFNISPGLWWISVPFYITTGVILWTAVLVEMCVLWAQLAVISWWIGWYAGVFD